MTRKLFAVVLLSLAAAACDSSPTETNTNAGSPAKATPSVQAPPTPEPSPMATPQLKAGDKVKVSANGSSTEATVVSVDEKAGKVTVKIQGQTGEKIVAIADLVKQ